MPSLSVFFPKTPLSVLPGTLAGQQSPPESPQLSQGVPFCRVWFCHSLDLTRRCHKPVGFWIKFAHPRGMTHIPQQSSDRLIVRSLSISEMKECVSESMQYWIVPRNLSPNSSLSSPWSDRLPAHHWINYWPKRVQCVPWVHCDASTRHWCGGSIKPGFH